MIYLLVIYIMSIFFITLMVALDEERGTKKSLFEATLMAIFLPLVAVLIAATEISEYRRRARIIKEDEENGK